MRTAALLVLLIIRVKFQGLEETDRVNENSRFERYGSGWWTFTGWTRLIMFQKVDGLDQADVAIS
jgi:hypothetical protein